LVLCFILFICFPAQFVGQLWVKVNLYAPHVHHRRDQVGRILIVVALAG